MAVDQMNDKFSIKNLLFYRAIPNYTIPVSTEGYKTYACTDCCDRFIFKSSYEYHINRKSVKITYACRHCNETKTFLNRCNLLSHIRSHTFKTATINVSDLKIEPLPISHFQTAELNEQCSTSSQLPIAENQKRTTWSCYECRIEFITTGSIYKDRAKHYMKLSNMVKICPVCLFALPTTCALKAHLRIHTNSPPFYCPECGQHLSTNCIQYPYTHHCEGFYMMRATSRLKCPAPECFYMHPNDIKEHLTKKHLHKVFKCQACVVACFNDHTMQKHLKTHYEGCKALIYYQCSLCPGRLVLRGQINNHVQMHVCKNVYPCWECGFALEDINSLLQHHIKSHTKNADIRMVYQSIININEPNKSQMKAVNPVYRGIKRCEQCKRSFAYKCTHEELLSIECPYKCTPNMEPNQNITLTETPPFTGQSYIKCPLCKSKISEDWEVIKEHYATYHKSHRCIDIKVISQKISNNNLQKYQKKYIEKVQKTRRSRKAKTVVKLKLSKSRIVPESSEIKKITTFKCRVCDYNCENKQSLQSHISIHRDPCMAYQCMECGQSFVVKPSFSTHLLLEHNIDNVAEYITENKCYNKNALQKHTIPELDCSEPVQENQCKICREQFNNSDDLEKHFRMHGMAFLLKNTSNKIS